jgi:hypothetical protein
MENKLENYCQRQMQQIHMASCPQIMQRERLNMNVHKNKWEEAKSICRTKKRFHEMESLD